MKKLLPIVAIPLLMACDRTQTPGRAEVNFDTDSSVLRGTWNGGSTRVGEDQTLSLEVTATYIDDSSYSISGKGLLNNDEVTVSGVGKLSPHYKYVKSQASPAPFANAVFKLVGKVTGESAAYCGGYSSLGELAYFCTVEPGSAYFRIAREK